METQADYGAILARADEVLEDLEAGRSTTDQSPMKHSQRDEYQRAEAYAKKAGVSLLVCAQHFAKAARRG